MAPRRKTATKRAVPQEQEKQDKAAVRAAQEAERLLKSPLLIDTLCEIDAELEAQLFRLGPADVAAFQHIQFQRQAVNTLMARLSTIVQGGIEARKRLRQERAQKDRRDYFREALLARMPDGVVPN